MVRIDPAAYIFCALLLLTQPLNWLAAAVFAAAFHELCHILAIFLTGNRVERVRIGLGGAEIKTEFASARQELLCALAGPGGSLLMLLLCRNFPRLALCGAVQGCFNLLPIYPMDGGRVLACILEIYFPAQGERVRRWAELGACGLLLVLAVAGSLAFSLGILPVSLAVLLICRGFQRKIPCKQEKIRVQ